MRSLSHELNKTSLDGGEARWPRGRRFGRAPRIGRLLVAPIVGIAFLAGVNQAVAATWTVTTTADTPLGNGNCQPNSCSLRQAIKASSTGDTIVSASQQ